MSILSLHGIATPQTQTSAELILQLNLQAHIVLSLVAMSGTHISRMTDQQFARVNYNLARIFLLECGLKRVDNLEPINKNLMKSPEVQTAWTNLMNKLARSPLTG